MGGEIKLNHHVTGIHQKDGIVVSVCVLDKDTGQEHVVSCDYCLSTMPVCDLITSLGDSVPKYVSEVASGLVYRDFITVGLLLNKMKIQNTTNTATVNNIIPDLWLYIQENDVKLGRMQIFNNWSPYLVADMEKIWIGLEYFCSEGDDLNSSREPDMISFAISELIKLGMIDDASNVLDSVVVKVPKAYPAYFGSYHKFDVIQKFVDSISNLFLIGRNGQHRYNNMDHSMLTAIAAVDNIISGDTCKNNIWSVNTEQDYHEQKQDRK